MNGLTTIGEREAGTPLPRLYLRPDEAARAIGVSRRTLSAWQSARVIGFRRVGRTILFSVADIQTAIDRYRIAPIGEPRARRQSVKTGTITSESQKSRKRRIDRIGAIPQSENITVGNSPIQAEIDCEAQSAAE
jgi:excisionase family DNA binding protein